MAYDYSPGRNYYLSQDAVAIYGRDPEVNHRNIMQSQPKEHSTQTPEVEMLRYTHCIPIKASRQISAVICPLSSQPVRRSSNETSHWSWTNGAFPLDKRGVGPRPTKGLEKAHSLHDFSQVEALCIFSNRPFQTRIQHPYFHPFHPLLFLVKRHDNNQKKSLKYDPKITEVKSPGKRYVHPFINKDVHKLSTG